MAKRAGSVRNVKDSIMNSSALRRERPRPIDQFIDYFGSPGSRRPASGIHRTKCHGARRPTRAA